MTDEYRGRPRLPDAFANPVHFEFVFPQGCAQPERDRLQADRREFLQRLLTGLQEHEFLIVAGDGVARPAPRDVAGPTTAPPQSRT